MTCHVRIAANADLKTMKDADVPFMACVSCHNDKLTEESAKRAAATFQCTYCPTGVSNAARYCHTTSGFGRFHKTIRRSRNRLSLARELRPVQSVDRILRMNQQC